MRIGHYSPWLLSPGGINSYLRRVVEAQINQGHQILLFNRPNLVPSTASCAFGASVVPTNDDSQLLAMARQHVLDVLHIHTHIVAYTDPSNGTPVVRTVHGHEPYCPSGRRHLRFPVNRPCPRACHILGCTWGHFINRCGSVRPANVLNDFKRVASERENSKRFFTIAVSEFVREQMIRSGHDGSRIDVIVNPAPASRGEYERLVLKGGPRFLYLGRLVPEKGVDWLLHGVAKAETPLEVTIAGSGPNEPFLRNLADRLGIGRSIKWRGWLAEEEVRAEITRAWAVILPSVWHEPAGLATVEAAAVGRMVIASRVGGIPEYAERLGNALLVEPYDIEGLAATIRRVATTPSMAEQLGAEGWKRVPHLDLDSHVARLESVYEKAITERAI